MPLSVLYLHPISTFGGASRSLMELLRGLPDKAVQPYVVVPRGQVADMMIREGYAVEQSGGIAQYDCTRFGHYRGLRWLILLREAAFLPTTLWTSYRVSARWRNVDLIHVNEITALIAALLINALLHRPLVVHVRSVQQVTGIRLRRRLLEYLLRRYVDAVVAIDETVRASLPADMKIDIVHNSFTPTASSEIPPAVADLRNRFSKDSLRVGMVGNLLAMKGVYEFLEAAKICVAKGLNVDFVIVGINPRPLSGLKGFFLRRFGFAHNLEADIQRLIGSYGLDGRLHRLGFTSDVSSVYRSLDLLCFPSHLDAVGRPVIEAAWFGVPSIVALDHQVPDTFVDGKTGVAVPSRNPEVLAAVISRLYGRRDEVRRMGDAARQLAETGFDSQKNARAVLAVYQRALDQHRQKAVGR